MPPAPSNARSFDASHFDASCVFQTADGAVQYAGTDELHVTLGSHAFTIPESGLASLRNAARTLYDNVERCGRCDGSCRWQLRVTSLPKNPVLVLDADELEQLVDLLGGASTMLELGTMLDDAGIQRTL
jgi:hypothetical protein